MTPESSRRTQSARSGVSRQLILDATIKVLEEEGLAAATTLKIQRVTGVSRGRLLHHFASREALLVAAVQHLAQARIAMLAESSAAAPATPRLHYAIDSLWSLYNGPLFWAAMELWNGSRTDPSLRDALLSQEKKLGVLINELCDDLFGERIVRHSHYEAFKHLLISSMRGVAMTYTFDPRPITTDPHRSHWELLAMTMLTPQE